jgi:hypothetical protein
MKWTCLHCTGQKMICHGSEVKFQSCSDWQQERHCDGGFIMIMVLFTSLRGSETLSEAGLPGQPDSEESAGQRDRDRHPPAGLRLALAEESAGESLA